MSSLIYLHSSVSPILSDSIRKKLSAQDFSQDGDHLASGDIVLFGAECAEGSLELFENLSAKGVRVFVSGTVSSEAELRLVEAGIPCFAEDAVYEANLPGIFTLPNADNGSLLIIGAGSSAKKILSVIAETSGCRCEYADSLEQSVEKMNNSHLMVIHDLSCEGVPLLQFVKRMSHSALKSLPYIAYKSSGQRIDMNDLQSGIKNYTRVILSQRECYAQTAMILFKKAYYPLLSELCLRNEKELRIFSEESLKKVYFTHQDVFFAEHAEKFSADISDGSVVMEKIKILCGRFLLFRRLMNTSDNLLRISEAGAGIQSRQ
jgi:hypothetical protein